MGSQLSDGSPIPGVNGNNDASGYQASTPNAKQRSTPSQISGGTPKKTARSVSRGRQPKRRDASTNVVKFDPQIDRATSADSIINTLLHTRVGKRHSYDKESQRPPDDRMSHDECPHARNIRDESGFERVEVVSCPSCPVHGHQSASINDSSKRLSDPSGQKSHVARDMTLKFHTDPSYDITGQKGGMKKAGANQVLTVGATTADTLTGSDKGISYLATNEQMGINGTAFIKTTLHITPSQSEPRSIKPRFNPTTPRAMRFHPDDACIDTLPGIESGGDEQSPSWLTVDTETLKAEVGSKA